MNGRRSALTSTTALLATAALSACWSDPLPGAERVVLERELASLSIYSELDFGSVLGEGDMLIVLHERTLAELVTATLPIEQTIDNRFRVQLRSAEVDFRTGLALAQFSGRVSLVDRPTVFVDATVFGLLQIAGLDQALGVLLARVEILAVEAQEVSVGGWSAPAARLASELATRKGKRVQPAVRRSSGADPSRAQRPPAGSGGRRRHYSRRQHPARCPGRTGADRGRAPVDRH